MIYTKNKVLRKITAFLIVLTLLLWIIPVSIVFGSSEEDLKEAYEKALITLETAQEEVVKADSDLESAQLIAAEAGANLEAAKEELNIRNENYASAAPEVEKLKEKLTFAQAAADEANSFYERIKETGSEEEINAAKKVVEKANAELELISKEYNDANSNLMTLQNELDEAKAEFEELKSAADEANSNLLYDEKVLNEKNENLNIAQEEVERTKAELEAYLAEIAEKETDIEEGASDGEDTGEEILEESTVEEIIEEEAAPTEEDIAEENTTPLEEEQSEEVTAEEDTISGEEEIGEEVVSEESVNVEVTDEGNVPEEGIEEENTDENLTEGATSDEGVSEEEIWISLDASDEGTGTIDNPFTIDAALSHTVNGDILYFLPGTYNTSVNLDGIGTGTEGVSIETETEEELPVGTETEEELPVGTETEEDLSIKFIAYDDVIFDGQSTLDYAFYFSTPLSYLSFYNFTFINYLNSAIYINNEDVTNIEIVDNTFSNNGTAIDITMDSDLNIQNNIIVDNDAGVVISADDVNIEHNVIAFNEEGIVVDDTRNNITVDYNDVFGNVTDYQGVEPGENDISVDPMFADKGNLDFTLLKDSPLLDNKIIRLSSTDKDDYYYGEQLVITGSGYEPFQDLIIKILRPDGTFVKNILVTTDENGDFTYEEYYVDYAGKNYLVKITDANENILEVLGFTDTTYVDIYIQNVPAEGIDSKDNTNPGGPFYGTDNGGLSDPVVWHFILNQLRTNPAAPEGIITAWFDINGSNTSFTATGKLVGNGQNQHFYVGTPSECILLDTTYATVEAPQDTANLILSHIVHNIPGTGSITVSKTGLEGSDTAIFELYWVDNPAGESSMGTITFDNTTNDPSSDSWLNLPYGEYRIEERYPASGNVFTYTTNLDETARYFINAGNPSETVDVNNTPEEGSITVTKTGLEGSDQAKLTLKDSKGNVVSPSPQTVSNGGTATWSDLPYGTYTLEESFSDLTNTYAYTVLSPVTIVVDEATEERTVENTPEKGEIKVTKTGLEGSDQAKLTLKDSKGNVVSPSPQTVSNGGTATWSDLPYGTYTLEESFSDLTNTYAYTVLSPVTIVVDEATEERTVENTPELGEIEIQKTDETSGEKLEGSTFELWKNSSPVLIDTITLGPGSGGYYKWTDLDFGTYVVKETIAPPGYLLAPEITVNLDKNNPKASLLLEIADPRIPGEITLNKSGLGTNDIAGFTLYDSNNDLVGIEKRVTGNGSVVWSLLPWDTYKIVETTTPAGYAPIVDITAIVVGAGQQSYSFDRVNTKITILGSITLNKSGLGSTDTAGFTLYNSAGVTVGGEMTVIGNGSVTWADLPWDTYKIVETTTPAGYTPIADITGIVIGAVQQSYSFDRVNTKIVLGSITLNKSGLGSTDTAGFTLYGSSGAAVGGEKTVIGNGSVSWTGLAWDTYKIVETTTPPGYTPIADITGIVVGAAQQSYSFDRVNTKITILGSIILNKSGLGSKDTAGFTLYDSTGAVVGGEKTVIGNGSVSWTNLPWDTYTIRETTTPSGYTPIADITGIVVGAAQQSYSFDRVNTKKTTTTTITTTLGVIEVLGIQELPFTGINPIIPISGILSMFIGAILLVISVSKRRRKEI